MTNAQLLITARRVHEATARDFAEAAEHHDPGSAEYQDAADALAEAAIDFAIMAGAVDGANHYPPPRGDVIPRLESWRAAPNSESTAEAKAP